MVTSFRYHTDMLSRSLGDRTADNRFSQRDLILIIKSKVKAMNRHTECADNTIYEQIIPSFSKTGIIETYDELGMDEWDKLISNIIRGEMREQGVA